MPRRDLPLRSLWDEGIVSQHLKPMHYVKMYHWLIHSKESQGLETPLQSIPFDRWIISKKDVSGLVDDVVMTTTKVVERHDSARGDSTKLLVELQDGHRIETVVMRHSTHATVCVSSQIGCKMGCRFCATGTMGIIGDLTSGEIIEQLMHANKVTKIRNVVFMGMGEPLNNFENVKQAVLFMVDDKRFGLSPKQVTISTVGVLKNMRRLSDELPQVNMALSLHAPSQSVRIKIVPAAAAHHIDKLLEAVDYHIRRGRKANNNKRSNNAASSSSSANNNEPSAPADDAPHFQSQSQSHEYNLFRRRLHSSGVMIEYILIHDVNDREEHAHELGRLLGPRSDFVLLNLIPYNPTSVAEDYEPPTDEAIRRFYEICSSAPYDIHTRVRGEKGQDIEAACGQLALVKPGEGRNTPNAGSFDLEDLGLPKNVKAKLKTTRESAKLNNRQRQDQQGTGVEVEGPPKKWLSIGLWMGLPALALALSATRR